MDELKSARLRLSLDHEKKIRLEVERVANGGQCIGTLTWTQDIPAMLAELDALREDLLAAKKPAPFLRSGTGPIWRFTIPGPPQEQGRGRIIRRGPHGAIKDPDEVAEYKVNARQALERQAPRERLDGALRCNVTIYITRPKSKPKRITLPATRPDIDNYVKCILDCLDSIVVEDSRITDLMARKRYAAPEEAERVEIELQQIEPN